MNYGGAETIIMNLYRNIDRKKVQFDFVVHTDKKGAYDDEIKKLGGEIFHTQKYELHNYFSYKEWWKKFFDIHPEYRVVHGHINSSASIYLGVANSMGRYTIVHSHATTIQDKGLRKYIFKLTTYPLRHMVDYYYGCSVQAGIDRFGAKMVFSSGKFSVMKNGINLEDYKYNSAIRSEVRKDMSEKSIVIGHVGRFAEVKNHSYLIRVFESFHNINKNSELWLVGNGTLQDDIKQVVEQKNLGDSVKFIGQTGEVYKYLMGMDVFVFPSRYEGLGISLIEAQAAGLPCVTSEAIQDEAILSDNVVKLPFEDIERWVKCILKYTTLDNKRTNAYKKVEKAGYNIGLVAEEMQEFYICHSQNSYL